MTVKENDMKIAFDRLYLALLCIMLLLTYKRNAVWLNELNLFSDIVNKSPYVARGHYFLAKAYKGSGALDKAIIEYQLSLRYDDQGDNLSDCYNDLGRIYMQLRQVDSARENFEQAVKMNPQNSIAYNNLGLIYLYEKNIDKAIANFKNAIFYSPDYAKAHLNLARALTIKGSTSDAERELQIARELGMNVPD